MNILCIGDVVAKSGREFLRDHLPKIKAEYAIDITVVNGENSSSSNGISASSATHILDSGADCITTGNHAFRKRDIYDYMERNPQVIRPYNMPPGTPGGGYYVIDKGRYRVAVINLIGNLYMNWAENAFLALDRVLQQIEEKYIIVDFHAEATSEKKALGYYADGRVSVLFGTHTHVQTADETVLPCGTAYITDVGMTGPEESVLGVQKEIIIEKFKTSLPKRFETADTPCRIHGIVICLNDATGRAESIRRIQVG